MRKRNLLLIDQKIKKVKRGEKSHANEKIIAILKMSLDLSGRICKEEVNTSQTDRRTQNKKRNDKTDRALIRQYYKLWIIQICHNGNNVA